MTARGKKFDFLADGQSLYLTKTGLRVGSAGIVETNQQAVGTILGFLSHKHRRIVRKALHELGLYGLAGSPTIAFKARALSAAA